MMLRKFIFTLSWLLLTVIPVLAQAACPTLVNTALDAIGDNCADLDRNTACYGFDRVDTLFSVPQPADFFSQPTDRTELVNLETIKTFPLDTATGRFGVAIMNVQANVPESLPGQGVIFMLVGDAEMINSVAPDEAVVPAEAIDVTTAADTPLYALPAITSNTRGTAAAGTTLQADGFNGTGNFLRIISNQEIAWVPVSAITPDAAVTALPTLNSASKTPMQAFYFSTGVGQPACSEAEASIAVQSPENITVDLTVNGVDIQVGSLVTLTNNTITVHRGSVTTATGQVIEANQTLVLERDDDGNFIGTGELRPISDEEFERGQQAQDGINNVAENNGWQTLEITPLDETPAGNDVPDDGTIIHIVRPGESLYSIARLYDASMPAIAGANNLVDPFIVFVGQRLRIPNPGSGFVGITVRPVTTDDTPLPTQEVTAGLLDCTGFRQVSGGASLISTFSWTPVAGADQYKLNFFGSEGNYVASRFVTPPSTSIDVNMGDIGTGGTYQWEVEALLGGRSFCNTGRSASSPKPVDDRPIVTPKPPVAAAFTASRVCSGGMNAFVTWANAPTNTTLVNVFGDDVTTGDYNQNFPPADNTVLIGVSMGLQSITVTTFAGASPSNTVVLGGCP